MKIACQCELIGVTRSVERTTVTYNTNCERFICWIQDCEKLSIGSIITLQGVEGMWIIEKIHEREMETKNIKRNWNVGGL